MRTGKRLKTIERGGKPLDNVSALQNVLSKRTRAAPTCQIGLAQLQFEAEDERRKLRI